MSGQPETKPTIADMMAAYAQDAVDHAKRAAGVALDFSPESISCVELVMEKLHAAMPRGLSRFFRRGPSEKEIAVMAKMYGGYIGEVIRKTSGGEWVFDLEIAPGETVISLRKGSQRIFPPAKVYKRLTNGSEDNVWVYYQALMQDYWNQ